MEQQLLTIEEVKKYFKVKDNRTIYKFIKQGLKYVPIGNREKRFDPNDLKEFVEIQKKIVQEDLEIKPMRKKVKNKAIDIDFQKRKINLELNKVV